ncbi:MAG TPA: tRNA uridine-5-carboxymethylaminomethyl(34) synthesis GTPase MnmE [Candidatus Borkfalkia avistercoris]|uniref:tRNA modification GTPase MnmE n=1 Tax=Candidatus Borkfalkia avistercoris TaxID=2838504 RepID=A0A9D2IDP9_9FIRM|nr:tRNA uridine-5-carboxymethylaminomethyl(34) synthesis GTPase MnmE [Candidatus Borkfalkia avistercoris]
MKSENIAAVSTPAGRGGVAVIRLSGDSPLAVAEQMFLPRGNTRVKDFQPYRMYPGEIVAEHFKDFGLCVYFKAPHSFTGEDVVEFHCHGGTSIARGILSRALSLGCRGAERGEFTKRAFLNGKLSLSSAEGLIDMINGESEAEVRAGYMLYGETLKNEADGLQAEITDILAGIDADMDFPEEDIEHTDLSDIAVRLKKLSAKLSSLTASYGTGRKIKQGVRVVIAGRPNTGKSSLLNALLQAEKAIVSSVPGTTRDAVEGTLEIEGVRFNLYDTAGIRESENEIENIGIARARALIDGADLILFVLDGSEKMSEEDEEIYRQVADKPKIVVSNKNDLQGEGGEKCDIRVSAKTGENIAALRAMMLEKSMAGYDTDAAFLIEKRHYDALACALAEINEAVSLCGNVPLDLLGVHLKAAWDKLGEISGKTATEEIINEIFSKFCVGK